MLEKHEATLTHFDDGHSELILDVEIVDSEWISLSNSEIIGMAMAAIVRAMSYNPQIIGLLSIFISIQKRVVLGVKHYICYNLIAKEDIEGKMEKIIKTIIESVNEIVTKELHKGKGQWNQKIQPEA
jgi:hypothetical protein